MDASSLFSNINTVKDFQLWEKYRKKLSCRIISSRKHVFTLINFIFNSLYFLQTTVFKCTWPCNDYDFVAIVASGKGLKISVLKLSCIANLLASFLQSILLVFLGLWRIKICGLSNAKSIFIQVNSSILNNSVKVHSLIVKNILFQAIRFSQTVLIQTIKCQNRSI